MKIIFMGTPLFALSALERLIESRHEVALVVTQPDKKAGRGRKSQTLPIKAAALEHGIELIQPATIRDDTFLEKVRAVAPDAIVVVAYGKILPAAVLRAPRLGCVNVHASLLPRYRGAAPINWAVIDGETESGVTIMQMDEGMDTGGIIRQETVPILDDDDARSLSDMLSATGAQTLLEVLDEAEREGGFHSKPQDESQATLAPILKKEDGRIDWSQTTGRIICHVRGMLPWPCAFTQSPKGILRILQAESLWPAACENIHEPGAIPEGMVALTLKSHGIAVRTLDGFLLVTRAQMEGKRPMTGVDLINGKWIEQGDTLS